jgi:hypothetical protein
MMLTRMRFFLTQINIKACAKNLVIPFSFITPILMLFVLDPNSFNYTWKGRTLSFLFMASISGTHTRLGKTYPKELSFLKKVQNSCHGHYGIYSHHLCGRCKLSRTRSNVNRNRQTNNNLLALVVRQSATLAYLIRISNLHHLLCYYNLACIRS